MDEGERETPGRRVSCRVEDSPTGRGKGETRDLRPTATAGSLNAKPASDPDFGQQGVDLKSASEATASRRSENRRSASTRRDRGHDILIAARGSSLATSTRRTFRPVRAFDADGKQMWAFHASRARRVRIRHVEERIGGIHRQQRRWTQITCSGSRNRRLPSRRRRSTSTAA